MTEKRDRRGPQAFPGSVAVPSKEDADRSPDPAAEGRGAGGEGLRILAFDAGNTSGTALYDGGGLVLGQCRGREAAFELLSRVGRLDALAYEQFVIRQPIKDEHATVVYVNGAIEYEAWRRKIPFYRYTPAVSKRRISDELLQSLGWWPGFGLRTGGHAADAARILVCTLTDHYPMEMMDHA
jgi:hypothetical protein